MKLDYPEILSLLPVRHAMVQVERVITLEPGVEIQAEQPVTGREPCYDDLAEGLPRHRYAYPRSLVIESFGQASALLWRGTLRRAGTVLDKLPMVGRLRDCRFHGSAFPGDVIRHTVRVEKLIDGNAFMSGDSRVGDRTILTVGSVLAVERELTTVLANR